MHNQNRRHDKWKISEFPAGNQIGSLTILWRGLVIHCLGEVHSPKPQHGRGEWNSPLQINYYIPQK